MNKKILIQDIADVFEKNNLCSKAMADNFLRTTFEIIAEFLEIDEFVKIKGLGTFKLVVVGKRESVNVNTGERIQIEGHSKVTFTPDASIKDLINKPFSQFQTVVINSDTDINELESVGTDETINEMPETVGDVSEAVSSSEETEAIDDDSSDNEQDAEPNDVLAVDDNNDAPKIVDSDSCVADEIEEKVSDNNELPPLVPTLDEEVREEALPETNETETVEQPVQEPLIQKEYIKECSEPSADTSAETGFAEQETLKSVDKAEVLKSSKKCNILKAVFYSISIIVLLILSYAAGYVRLFNIDWAVGASDNVRVEEEKPTVNIPVVVPKINKDTNTVADKANDINTSAVENKSDVKTEVKIADKPKQVENDKSKMPITSEANKNLAEKVVKKTTEASFSQVVGGKYKIVGTTGTRIVDKGETLRQIAEAEYGSKGYAQYIIIHNNIKNPDNVQAGTVLKLPKLESR